MGNFALKDFKFVYTDETGDEVLIDLTDNLSNKGRVPFHSEFTDITIPSFIAKNMDNHEAFCEENTELLRYEAYFTLIDVLFIKKHIQSKYPKIVVEIGNNDHTLQNHLTEIIKDLHPETKYYKIPMPQREMINSIEDNSADYVIFYGCEGIDLDEIITSACGKLKKDGLLILFSLDQVVTEKLLGDRINSFKKYTLGGKACIFTNEMFTQEQ